MPKTALHPAADSRSPQPSAMALGRHIFLMPAMIDALSAPPARARAKTDRVPDIDRICVMGSSLSRFVRRTRPSGA
jgi:hypothetical protein